MPRADLLIDTSAFARFGKPRVAASAGPLIAQGRIALCAPVAFELGYSARSARDHDQLMGRLDAFEMAPTTDGDHRRALELQGLLAHQGNHRAISLVDALVAAIAENRGLTVLHYDADFELLSALTGCPNQWIAERGTAD